MVELKNLLAFCLMMNLVYVMMEATQNKKSFYMKGLGGVRTVHQKYNKWRVNRRENHLNYNFDDWEDKRPDVYDDLFFITSSNTSSPTNATNSAVTSTESTPIITPTGETPLPDLTSTLQTSTVTETSTNTSLGLKETNNTSSQDIMNDITSPQTDGQNITSEVTKISLQITVAIESTPSSSITTLNPIVEDISSLKEKQRGGYFSAALIVLMRTITMKHPEDLSPLIGGLHREIVRLNAEHRLAFFGGSVLTAIDILALFLVNTPVEIIRIQAEYARNLLMNRQTEIPPDANGVLDVVDTVYNEEDVQNIAKVLEDVIKYPNTDKTPLDIARELLEAMVFEPHDRIIGTPRERLLMMEINNVVKNRLPPGMAGGRRNVMKDMFLNEYKASKIGRHLFISKSLKTKRYSKTKGYLRTKKVTSDEEKYTDYVKNITIMERLKKKMRQFKEKMKLIRGRDRKKSTKRGPSTTTTTTTTTTARPPMHKSKYYMRKYVKKNLYKMKTTTVKTTTFQWRYHGKIRKFNDDIRKNSETSSSNISIECSSNDSSKSGVSEEANSENANEILKASTKHSDYVHKYQYLTQFRHKTPMFFKSVSNVEVRGTKGDGEEFNSESDDHDILEDSNVHSDNQKINKYLTKLRYTKPIQHMHETKEIGASNEILKDSTKYSDNRQKYKYSTQFRHTIPMFYKSVTKDEFSGTKGDGEEFNSESDENFKNSKKHSDNHQIDKYSTKLRYTKPIQHMHDIKEIEDSKYYVNDKKSHKVNTKTEKRYNLKNIAIDTESYDEESILKVNIDNAIYHRENFTNLKGKRRYLEVNKLWDDENFSDDEAVMKARIYQMFGYSENFAKRLRIMKGFGQNNGIFL